MRYEWDETKRQSNIVKHAVDFAVAEGFEWDVALIMTSMSSNEPRLVAVAPINLRLHVLVFSIETRVIRIISQRKANKREAKLYVAQI
ncbi:BrnT family toxin [Acetobacter suratthaniensis]|uniref:BrnT family toxin n=1 Tax=Acetobacter suratthaniensis TaxID=1502841 RepID=A0ABS3LPT8_9PROT|nr:BrnT family toxin [Acetobacter suratthaniensis]MBO1329370.1 BrnT family toxin [Acetobacter suratthaniensis]MCX2567348.1 BrnT family toxin [Acetobacter suratthaniensis]